MEISLSHAVSDGSKLILSRVDFVFRSCAWPVSVPFVEAREDAERVPRIRGKILKPIVLSWDEKRVSDTRIVYVGFF